jgi:hypothetical protein
VDDEVEALSTISSISRARLARSEYRVAAERGGVSTMFERARLHHVRYSLARCLIGAAALASPRS